MASEHDSHWRLWERIREDWIAHGRDWTRPGFRAVAIYRFGVWRMRLRPKLLRAPFSVVYRMFYRRIRNHYSIDLPYSVRLGRRVIIEHCGTMIHGNSIIGNDCIIRHGVILGINSLSRLTDAPQLGDNVDIGAGAKLLGKVRVGNQVRIGANAVVLTDVPEGATVFGVPARVVWKTEI